MSARADCAKCGGEGTVLYRVGPTERQVEMAGQIVTETRDGFAHRPCDCVNEVTRVERVWRCANCDHEAPHAPNPSSLKPRYGHAMTHACDDGVVGVMHVVERERIYASEAERRLIEHFEKSDWGLLSQAARDYNVAMKRSVRRKNPSAWRALESVFKRVDALERACHGMSRTAHRDSDANDGVGRIANLPAEEGTR